MSATNQTSDTMPFDGMPLFYRTDNELLIVLHKNADEWVGICITSTGAIMTSGPLNQLDTAESQELVNTQKAQGFAEAAKAASYCLADAQGYLSALPALPSDAQMMKSTVNTIAAQLESLTHYTGDLYGFYERHQRENENAA